MALPSDYVSGTISLQNGEVEFTGTGTGWLAAGFREGDLILDIAGAENLVAVVQTIDTNTSGTLSKPWSGPTLTNVAYRIRYAWDSARVGAQARQLIEMLGNGNLEAVAALVGPGVMVMDGPHTVTVKPVAEFVNGVTYDVQVNTLAQRATYNAESAGFAVLVSNNGDGRAALYSKLSNASGDWSAPAYITGPTGSAPTITAEVGALPAGSTPVVTVTPIAGGYNLDFDLPAAEGFQARGTWSNSTAYAKGDVVGYNGSSFVAKRVNTGVTPAENADWGLLAAKGADGTGTGDVSGPAASTHNSFAIFEGTTGKLIKSVTAQNVWENILRGDASVMADLKWMSVPIGGMIAVPNLAGQDVPPNTAAHYRYIKLTASDSYNSGVLGSQSVSGSAPLINATAVVTLAGSPMNGVTVRLINTEGRFLRAGGGNAIQDDALQEHIHWAHGTDGTYKHVFNAYPISTSYNLSFSGSGYAEPNLDKGGVIHPDHSSRKANETRPRNISTIYYMRIR